MSVKNKLDKFFSKKPLNKIKKGEVFIQPGDAIDKIYYLIRGNVKQYVVSSTGEEIVIHIFDNGSFFPIALVLGKSPNNFYFQALNNVRVKVAETDEVKKMLKKETDVLLDLTQRLAKGLNGMVIRLENVLSNKVEDSLLSLITYLSKNYGKEVSKGTSIKLSLTHQDLASWLGVSRETVSREMKELQKAGKIDYKYKQITLLNN